MDKLNELPEKLEPIKVDIGIGEMESSYEKGWNDLHDEERDKRIRELEEELDTIRRTNIYQRHDELQSRIVQLEEKKK